MNTKAKVNLLSVKGFSQIVGNALEYSPKFNNGINNINELVRWLTELDKSLKNDVSNMQISQNNIIKKIRSIQEKIANYVFQSNELQEQLNRLEKEVSELDEFIIRKNDQDETYKVSNPFYADVLAQIAATKGELSAIDAELQVHYQKLERANSVNSQLLSHIDVVEGVISSIEEKKNRCVQLRAELEDAKNTNSRKSTNALGNLKRIEKIISNYLHIKMVYERAIPINRENVQILGKGSSNINININKTNVVQNQSITQTTVEEMDIITKEDIEKHQIKYDENGRIYEYEGRKYGGLFNSYEERLNITPLDNSILGKYQGVRGESKFIPSNLIAEGIIVKEILAEYGQDGIVYRNAEPDFEVCSEAIVKIDVMTENRELNNFPKADIECAKLWNLEEKDGKKDWSPGDVMNYRKANCLTWHEKCDTRTMVLVRTEINAYFKHSGGCSECRVRDSNGNDGDGFDE